MKKRQFLSAGKANHGSKRKCHHAKLGPVINNVYKVIETDALNMDLIKIFSISLGVWRGGRLKSYLPR